jgi:hypothetical protein
MTVTGSVALSVAPSWSATGSETLSDSRPILVHSQTNSLPGQPRDRRCVYPTTMAEMNVPAKANVRILHIFRKKLACCQLSR